MRPHVILLFIASFLGTAVLVLGTRAFLVGWVFIIWAIVAPLFQVIGDVESTLAGLVGGGAVVIAVALLMHFIRSRFGRPDTTQAGSGWRKILAANPDWKFTTFLVSFLIVATMDVNYVLLAFSWTVFMSLEWSLKGLEHVRTASLDRVAAEFLGIGIAVAAVFLWSALENRRKARVGKK